MAEPRFHCPAPAGALQPGAELELPEAEARHARTVLRLRPGAAVRLFDGAGTEALAELTDCQRRRVAVRVRSVRREAPPVPRLGVALPPPKGKRAAAAVEELTELGVDDLLPLATARSVSAGGDLEKWRARAVEACKQCGRSRLPTVHPRVGIAALDLAAWERVFLCSLAAARRPAAEALAAADGASSLLWIVGPEGGLTEEEEASLRAAGARPVALGPHVLRIGTAAALAAGLTRALLGDGPA
jgi:16S rRNA (uracil1498-N3)-methyltransferase